MLRVNSFFFLYFSNTQWSDKHSFEADCFLPSLPSCFTNSLQHTISKKSCNTTLCDILHVLPMLSEAIQKMMDATEEKVIFDYWTDSSHLRWELYQEHNSSALRSPKQWHSLQKYLKTFAV